MNGYAGKGLYIDLSTGSITIKKISRDIFSDFIGGYLLGMKLLWDLYKPGIDALAPENPIIFSTGPLTGTTAPTGNSVYCQTNV